MSQEINVNIQCEYRSLSLPQRTEYSLNNWIIEQILQFVKNQSTTIRVQSLAKDLKLLCEVDAQPTTIQFKWTSNSSEHDLNDFMSNELSSILTMKPSIKKDVEVIQCWASNVVGHNRLPCLFIFIPPTRPQPVTDCKILNLTTSDLAIECTAGSDGGLTQNFNLQVFNNINNELILNETNEEKPVFNVMGLTSQSTYTALVYAVNDLGKSQSNELKLQTLKLLNKKLSNNSRYSTHYYHEINIHCLPVQF